MSINLGEQVRLTPRTPNQEADTHVIARLRSLAPDFYDDSVIIPDELRGFSPYINQAMSAFIAVSAQARWMRYQGGSHREHGEVLLSLARELDNDGRNLSRACDRIAEELYRRHRNRAPAFGRWSGAPQTQEIPRFTSGVERSQNFVRNVQERMYGYFGEEPLRAEVASQSDHLRAYQEHISTIARAMEYRGNGAVGVPEGGFLTPEPQFEYTTSDGRRRTRPVLDMAMRREIDRIERLPRGGGSQVNFRNGSSINFADAPEPGVRAIRYVGPDPREALERAVTTAESMGAGRPGTMLASPRTVERLQNEMVGLRAIVEPDAGRAIEQLAGVDTSRFRSGDQVDVRSDMADAIRYVVSEEPTW